MSEENFHRIDNNVRRYEIVLTTTLPLTQTKSKALQGLGVWYHESMLQEPFSCSPLFLGSGQNIRMGLKCP